MEKIMKKLFIITLLCCFISDYSFANEIIHGIDIDKVYNSSDWSSREHIKSIINDYSLLQKYKQELSLCEKNTERQECLDQLAENILTHFYNFNLENNLNMDHDYVKSISAAYGVVYCLNKYMTPSGTMCNQENIGTTWEMVELYIKDLLQSVEHKLLGYSFLSDFKD